MTFIIDIDDTLIISGKYNCKQCKRVNYHKAKPIKDEILNCNMLYETGHTIILHTGRNWDCYDITIKQLENMGIKYHQLVMGKPQGIYIDKDSYKSIKEYTEGNK